MDPFDQTAPWSMESIRGCAKFLDRVWNLQTILIDGNEYSAKFEQMMHRAIKKVSSDNEDMNFNKKNQLTKLNLKHFCNY